MGLFPDKEFFMVMLKVDLQLPCRLDRYLKRLHPALTQGIIERALRLKQIKVNSCEVKASFRVNAEDEIFVHDSLNITEQTTPTKSFDKSVIVLANKVMNDYLIYQDDHLIAINKPADLACQGGSKISLSIDDALQYLNSQFGDFKLVHRLDKDTSGILLIAKNYASSIKLMKAFQEKNIQKTYLAVTLGKPAEEVGEISGMIGKNRGGVFEAVQNDVENGKLAVTHYKLINNLDKGLSLIEFTPITGRTHQLRFHAKMLGCPIVGDIKYGTSESIELSKKMLLHAKKIILLKEIFGEEIVINTELPNYFNLIAPKLNKY